MDIVQTHCAGLDVHKKTVAAVQRYPLPVANSDPHSMTLFMPAFFANAYDVFLLRQYFMSVPKELDEAAMLHGANPLRILVSVIVPQAILALTAVLIFHFFFVWNQYFEPLVYLLGNEKAYPVSVGIGQFVTTFGTYPSRSAATAVLVMLLPAVIFFLAQRQFMQGIVITGVEK
jgi:multiple sugar transport system permease protein